MKILFLVRSLGRGGAERQLIALAKGLSRLGWEVIIAVYYTGGAFEEYVRDTPVRVVDLKKRSRWDIIGFVSRLIRLVRKERPDVVHGYMSTSNVLAALVGRGCRVYFGVRASNMDYAYYDPLARLGSWLEARLSKFASGVICNSHAGARHAVLRGFDLDKVAVIHNGIDMEVYRRDERAGQVLRAQWGVPERALLIGMVARIDPMKDHGNFLCAASKVLEKRPDAYFLCVGDGSASQVATLSSLAKERLLGAHFIYVPGRQDVAAVLSALDVHCLSSAFGEGFPNTVAEAMACGVPCVATNVGDSAIIVGALGGVAPPRAPDCLAAAMLRVAEDLESRPSICRASVRRHIEINFSLDQLVRSTDILLRGTR